jgi:hypothetical protein
VREYRIHYAKTRSTDEISQRTQNLLGLLTATRKPLEVILTPVEVKERLAKYGDFSLQNRQFNTEKSSTTHERIKKSPELLIEYHRQFRETKKGIEWTPKPVEIIAEKIKELKLPPRIITKFVIGDFGCGEAELMGLLENKVYSFDHHNILNESIIACDIKSVSFLKDEDLDVAVFSLSLMGQNWPEYIMEAKRCLVRNGYLFIAVTTNDLKTRLFGLRNILKEHNFEIYSDEERSIFTFIEARKF